MKRVIAIAVLAILILTVPELDGGETTDKQPKGRDLITMQLKELPLIQVVDLFRQLTGANIMCDRDDLAFRKRVSINIKDKPWKPVFAAALAQHGFVLLRDPELEDSYVIHGAGSRVAVTRHRMAARDIAIANAVLEHMNKGNSDAAKKKLREFIALKRDELDALPLKLKVPKKTAHKPPEVAH